MDKRRPIDFIEIGTGHTALNSLLARVRQDCGNKKKVLLFDEIGDMDKESIQKLLNEIKNGVKRGEILFALLSQRDDSFVDPIAVPVPIEN